jgi:hypothetical protein
VLHQQLQDGKRTWGKQQCNITHISTGVRRMLSGTTRTLNAA